MACPAIPSPRGNITCSDCKCRSSEGRRPRSVWTKMPAPMRAWPTADQATALPQVHQLLLVNSRAVYFFSDLRRHTAPPSQIVLSTGAGDLPLAPRRRRGGARPSTGRWEPGQRRCSNTAGCPSASSWPGRCACSATAKGQRCSSGASSWWCSNPQQHSCFLFKLGSGPSKLA